jgi:hypothetical protein
VELFVVKCSSIGSIIDDKAIVDAGSKRRVTAIEAQGRINVAVLQTTSRVLFYL